MYTMSIVKLYSAGILQDTWHVSLRISSAQQLKRPHEIPIPRIEPTDILHT
jgi:hypothetical protein